MSVILALVGPMQSWGTSSRSLHRHTDLMPSKSGVVGLLAAALGRDREESVADLASLHLQVRMDQPGTVMRDFHTASFGKGHTQVTHRYYLGDAAFLVVLDGPEDLLSRIDAALRAPLRLLSLGRRSCIPSMPILVGSSDQTPADIMGTHPLLGRGESSTVAVVRDLHSDEDPDLLWTRQVHDYPLSFSTRDRSYTSRLVVDTNVTVGQPEHDPMSLAVC